MLCNKELWSIITGRSSLLQPAEIKVVLKDSSERFCKCLDAFKSASEASTTKVKNDKSVKRVDLMLNLSSVLNLDASQTCELFQSYLRTKYRGTRKQLQEYTESELSTDTLILKVVKFYFQERLFLLKCIHYILSYWQDPLCLFRAAFAAEVDEMVNSGFIDRVIAQLKSHFVDGMMHSGVQGRKAIERMHAVQGVKEQREILEILLLYYKDFEISGQKLIDTAALLQRANFGLKQPDKKHIFVSENEILRSISFLCSLIMLEGIDLNALNVFQGNASQIEDHHIFTKRNVIEKLDNIFLAWDDTEAQCPVVLAWSIVRYYTRDNNDQIYEELGKRATAFDVCGYLLAILDWISHGVSSVLSKVITKIIHSLVDHTFLLFHEDSFSDFQNKCKLLQGILSSSDVSLLESDIKSGVNILLESAKKRFPFNLCSYLDILTSMVEDDYSADHVFNMFHDMKSMTELFDRNILSEMQATDNPRIWIRMCDKVIIASGKDYLAIPSGSYGIDSGSDSGSNLIQWNFSYSGWNYLALYLRKHLEGIQDDNSREITQKITSIVKLLRAVISHDWAKAESLEPLISSVFGILKRFHNCTDALDLMSESLGLLTVVARQIPRQVVNQLNEFNFLPLYQDFSMIENNDSCDILCGIFGFVLDHVESAKGIYPVTVAYLQFLCAVCTSSSICNKADLHVYLANIQFVIDHIFGSFLHWKFVNPSEKKQIAKPILELCYNILGPSEPKESIEECENFISVAAELISDRLMNSKAGEPLLEILSTGVDSVNYSFLDYSSDTEEEKEVLIQIVKLAFAVLNKLLLRRQASSISALESAICTKIVLQGTEMKDCQETETVPLINVIAKYIYHDNDARLATLAVIALQKICVINSVSVLASFGNDAQALRNAYVICLESDVQPVKLRVAILELLTSAVETQPGLVELFLHQKFPTSAVKQPQTEELGGLSCLPAIFKFIDGKRSEYPLALKLASVRFLHSLWINRSDSALSAIRARSKFWINLVVPISESKRGKQKCKELELWTLIIEILALEIFYVANDDFDSDFVEAMNNLDQSGSYDKIMKIFECENDSSIEDFDETRISGLIASWRQFAIVGSVFHPAKVRLDTSERKEDLMLSLISCFECQVNVGQRRIIRELSCTIMVLSTRWASSLSDLGKILEKIAAVILLLLKNVGYGDSVVRNHLFSSFLAIGHQYNQTHCRKKVGDEVILRLASCICKCLPEVEVNNDKDENASKVLISMTYLLSVAAKCLHKKSSFYGILKENSTIPFLLSTMNYLLKVSKCVQPIDGIISFFLTLAENETLAELLSSSNILPNLIANVNLTNHTQGVMLNETWTLLLAFVTEMLKTLTHSVVDDVIDFVCAFKQRILQAADLAGRISSVNLLQESNEVSKLLMQLAQYWNRCMFLRPKQMHDIKMTAMSMLQASVALLSKPLLLNHIIQSKGIESIEMLIEKDKITQLSMSQDGSKSILHGSNVYDRVAGPSKHVQEILIEILLNATGMLKAFCPNLLDAVMEQEIVQQSYTPTIDLAFSIPSFDEMMPVSFGTFIASINTCLKILQEISSQDSPKSSPVRKTAGLSNDEDDSLKKKLSFIIENSLVIMISEASCFLRNAAGDLRMKQIIKRELGSEIQNFLTCQNRFLTRKNLLQTPRSAERRSPLLYRRSPSKLGFSFTNDKENCIYLIADVFSRQMLQ